MRRSLDTELPNLALEVLPEIRIKQLKRIFTFGNITSKIEKSPQDRNFAEALKQSEFYPCNVILDLKCHTKYSNKIRIL